MKNIKKLLFSVLAIGLFLVSPKVEAKTVSWDDLVLKLKENGRVVEEITNAKNNGESQDISITSDASKFTAVMTVDGETATFELNYSNGVVTFSNSTVIDSDEKSNLARLNDIWVNDVVLFAGQLYSYSSSEVVDFLSTSDFDKLTLATDGIEIKYEDYSYTVGSMTFQNDRITSFKLDLVNGFGGLVESPECQEDEPTDTPTPTPTPTPEATPEEDSVVSEPLEEEVTNPSTGDVQVYQVVGGIAVCMVIAISVAIHLRKKEEII